VRWGSNNSYERQEAPGGEHGSRNNAAKRNLSHALNLHIQSGSAVRRRGLFMKWMISTLVLLFAMSLMAQQEGIQLTSPSNNMPSAKSEEQLPAKSEEQPPAMSSNSDSDSRSHLVVPTASRRKLLCELIFPHHSLIAVSIMQERSTILLPLLMVFMLGCDPKKSWEAVIASYPAH